MVSIYALHPLQTPPNRSNRTTPPATPFLPSAFFEKKNLEKKKILAGQLAIPLPVLLLTQKLNRSTSTVHMELSSHT